MHQGRQQGYKSRRIRSLILNEVFPLYRERDWHVEVSGALTIRPRRLSRERWLLERMDSASGFIAKMFSVLLKIKETE